MSMFEELYQLALGATLTLIDGSLSTDPGCT